MSTNLVGPLDWNPLDNLGNVLFLKYYFFLLITTYFKALVFKISKNDFVIIRMCNLKLYQLKSQKIL